MRTIEGRTRYSRFGYAMANLGDINGDGFDGEIKINYYTFFYKKKSGNYYCSVA